MFEKLYINGLVITKRFATQTKIFHKSLCDIFGIIDVFLSYFKWTDSTVITMSVYL